MKTVTFYHSVICPRCHMAGLSLSRLLGDFPDIKLEKVEYLANMGRATKEGVRLIPTLISGDKKLGGYYLTKKSIHRFLESL